MAISIGKKGEFEDPHVLYRNPSQRALQGVTILSHIFNHSNPIPSPPPRLILALMRQKKSCQKVGPKKKTPMEMSVLFYSHCKRFRPHALYPHQTFFFDHNTNMATYDDPRVVEKPEAASNITAVC